MNPKLELGDIQGLAVRGYRMPYARFCYYRFTDPAQGRAWLGTLAEPVTTAEEWPKETDSTLNVALSYPGLCALDIDEATLSGFPQDFIEGMAARGPDQLGDVGTNAPEQWEPAFRDRAVHAVLMVWARSPEALKTRFDQAEALRPPGVELVGEQLASAPPDSREHFGYRDGISPSPALAGDKEPLPGQALVQPGEFILGYPDEIGQPAGSTLRPELRNNGTYAVYRKLYQDVAAFRTFLRKHARDVGGEELLAAKLVGRWRSGAPLVLAPDADDPALADDVQRNNDFDFARDDPRGLACPLGAHIRRGRPRDGRPGRERRLLVRRGLPYGPPLPEGAPDDGQDRGLIGIFLGASIERQFEFVQRAWLGSSRFGGLANESDPLVGSGGAFTIPGRVIPRRVTGMPRFVTVRGGEYLFLPSVSALRWLATPHMRSPSSSRLLTPSFA
jgi:Dyp-type peroxidase family